MAGKRAADETSPRAGQFLQPVKPSTSRTSKTRRDSAPRHAAPEEPKAPRAPRKKAAPKAAPVSAKPVSAKPVSAPPRAPAGDGGHGARKAHRARVIHQEARDYATRQAYRATNSKPSVVGRGAAGAAAGAASGAALGSVVPGVGTAVGAGAGGIVGGLGGAAGGARAKKAYKLATRTNGHARKIVVAEFAVCIVIAALSPMTKKDEPPGAFMKRMAALCGVFFILGLVSAAGRGAARAAAGFGGIVVVALAVSERDLFTKITTVFQSTDDKPAIGTGPGDGLDADLPERVGQKVDRSPRPSPNPVP